VRVCSTLLTLLLLAGLRLALPCLLLLLLRVRLRLCIRQLLLLLLLLRSLLLRLLSCSLSSSTRQPILMQHPIRCLQHYQSPRRCFCQHLPPRHRLQQRTLRCCAVSSTPQLLSLLLPLPPF
jgi:hypothetical protein